MNIVESFNAISFEHLLMFGFLLPVAIGNMGLGCIMLNYRMETVAKYCFLYAILTFFALMNLTAMVVQQGVPQ